MAVIPANTSRICTNWNQKQSCEIDCLIESKAGYEILHHPEAVTAQRIAQAGHAKGRHHAKVVMVKSREQHVIAVLSADHQIDLEKASKAMGKAVSLDTEK